MSQRKDTGLNTNPWPKLVDHYTLPFSVSTKQVPSCSVGVLANTDVTDNTAINSIVIFTKFFIIIPLLVDITS